uniref:NADH dehydrogenase subunit 6 n=1 Tax=Placopecten magellanicus TaxID=6577 RepID=Q4FE11_PLAMG|nr:NADH dehydrogenase subunit 6 [Placopecten magellanicus]AAZ06454.1 NADH dehydrogenase subunit 6 [Placopecten magellanicus]
MFRSVGCCLASAAVKVEYVLWFLAAGLFVGSSTLISPQAVGASSFLLVLLGCLMFGYGGAPWLSHFVFLSFLGGLLVVFLYAVALAPSPLFKGVGESVFPVLKVILFVVLVVCGYVSYKGGWCYFRVMMGGYRNVPLFTCPELVSSSWVGSVSFVGLAVVLAMCMVAVTKLCSFNKTGSLRGVRSTMS